MTDKGDNKKVPQDKLPQQESGFNTMVILTLLKENWYYILIGIILAFSPDYLYCRRCGARFD